MEVNAESEQLKQQESGERDNFYHHFSLTFDARNELAERFKDLQFILVAGCPFRAEAQARFLAERTFSGQMLFEKKPLERLTNEKSRFVLFKVGPVLVANHGMGAASMSIAIHELVLMSRRAQISPARLTIIRFGTCGGLGIPPGTVCVTSRAVDSMFQEFVELKVCMRLVKRPCVVHQATANLLEQLATENKNELELGQYEIRSGTTLASNDFYEEQGRLNGAICEHSVEDKARFLEHARKFGVLNFEMESNYLAAMCHKLDIPFGVICVSLANRLLGDHVELEKDEFALFERRLFWLNSLFIRHKLQDNNK